MHYIKNKGSRKEYGISSDQRNETVGCFRTWLRIYDSGLVFFLPYTFHSEKLNLIIQKLESNINDVHSLPVTCQC